MLNIPVNNYHTGYFAAQYEYIICLQELFDI